MPVSKPLSLIFASMFCTSTYSTIITYEDRSVFESGLSNIIIDDYQHIGYTMGDVDDFPINDKFTNERMSSIFGETKYRTTGHDNSNATAIYWTVSDNRYYCGGCNGSFELSFLNTSISNSEGVHAVGFNVANRSFYPYFAFVTFGNDLTQNFSLPTQDGGGETFPFWGVSSALGIKSIHFGDIDGLATTSGSFLIDNLTIANVVPEPSTVVIMSLGIIGLASRRFKKQY
jgi:hypothetical protein